MTNRQRGVGSVAQRIGDLVMAGLDDSRGLYIVVGLGGGGATESAKERLAKREKKAKEKEEKRAKKEAELRKKREAKRLRLEAAGLDEDEVEEDTEDEDDESEEDSESEDELHSAWQRKRKRKRRPSSSEQSRSLQLSGLGTSDKATQGGTVALSSPSFVPIELDESDLLHDRSEGIESLPPNFAAESKGTRNIHASSPMRWLSKKPKRRGTDGPG